MLSFFCQIHLTFDNSSGGQIDGQWCTLEARWWCLGQSDESVARGIEQSQAGLWTDAGFGPIGEVQILKLDLRLLHALDVAPIVHFPRGGPIVNLPAVRGWILLIAVQAAGLVHTEPDICIRIELHGGFCTKVHTIQNLKPKFSDIFLPLFFQRKHLNVVELKSKMTNLI